MDLVEVMSLVQAVLYVGLALAATRVWQRDRGRPAAYLAAAFVAIGLVTATGALLRRTEPDEFLLVRDLTVMLILSFPWLLAAFAWSFSRPRLPRWLRLAGVVQATLALTVLFMPPLGSPGDRPTLATVYVLSALVLWLALTGAAAARLWFAGARQHRVVRIRTGAMAAGAVTLGVILIAGATVEQTRTIALALDLVAIAAAALFGIGYVPPRPLRWWWRRLPASRIQRMQTDLIAASTPGEVAAAMAPAIAEVYGGGAIFVDPAGRILAAAELEDADAHLLAARVRRGEDDPRVHSVEVEGYLLAVRTSPYAPLFGPTEHELLGQFVLQVRLAIQRTELQAANEAARAEAQRAYDDQQQMLVGLAHDLRSPTVTISTYSSLIASADDLEDAKQMAEGLAGSAGYLDRLVDGISELSRIGRNDGQPEPVSLTPVVRQAASRLRTAYPGLRVELTTELPTFRVDRLRIEQVLDNLIGNAAKHGGRADLTVTVSAEAHEDVVRLVVADDGQGVPEREHEAVFALFRRGSAAGGQGSGVGLGLCRRIVDSYGGRIRFAPATSGARAEVDLPHRLLAEPFEPGRRAPAADVGATASAAAGGASTTSGQPGGASTTSGQPGGASTTSGQPGGLGDAEELGEGAAQPSRRVAEECDEDRGVSR